ncbi:BREX-1 system phosphatase PglZ type B [Clostridium algidicarnis]|uniref:BREX-1 system phosphatase PglZ type B n=1 Tax=Clostridium algidicarnis TaxID=37659 RepID=UPI000495F8B4|nr:BREX-1 system phosphatase PglZ type B [Clostridium algidicarnis]
MKVIDHIINSLKSSANYNPESSTKPSCILWTDKERKWEPIIDRLKTNLNEVLVLGEYNPEERIGPAIWIRVAIAGKAKEYKLPYGEIPIIYLPGVSRQDLRAIEQCPEELKPLAELQYRGVIWSQINARDWTLLAFLKSNRGGLGLDVSQDEDSLSAMDRAIVKLLDENVEILRGMHLDKDFFNSLISGKDIDKEMLMWLSNPDYFKEEKTKEEWAAFNDICISRFGFNAETDGVLLAAEKIGNKDSSWESIWDRFCEAPSKYEAIPNLLTKIVMPLLSDNERFPQWNEQEESRLRKELLNLDGLTEQDAKNEVLRLEKEHGARVSSVWSELNEAPLACSLKHLGFVASMTKLDIKGTFKDIESIQDEVGWKIDYAVIDAYKCVIKKEDVEAISKAIRAIYLPWLDRNARNLQSLVRENGYPVNKEIHPQNTKSYCYCFVDGLRYDIAKKLKERLESSSIKVKQNITWASLPTVTATCKPAIMPINESFIGDDIDNSDFNPFIKDNNQPATYQRIVKLLIDQDYIVIGKNQLDVKGDKAWYECGNIDEDGHNLGLRIISNIDRYLNDIVEEIEGLFMAGWESIELVTDHGWLLMPLGLPKISLPNSLSESKWGRCASIKPGSVFDEALYPWYWNNTVHFALADGVSCYRNGIEYTHGGISIQECLTLNMTLTKSEEQKAREIFITDVVWKGMRCKIAVEDLNEQAFLDIRLKPVLAESSIVMGIKEFKKDGTNSVVVDDDSYEAKQAYIVILDKNNQVLFQQITIVGGEV